MANRFYSRSGRQLHAGPVFALPLQILRLFSLVRQARDHLAAADWEKAVTHCCNTLERILDAQSLQLTPSSKFGRKVDTLINGHLPMLDREKGGNA